MHAYKPHIADFFLTGILLFLSLGAFIPLHSMRKEHGNKAVLYDNGIAMETISLMNNKVLHYKEMEIVVETGSIRINKSNCPHKICVHAGKISSPAQNIVCVPNKVMIKIESDGAGELNAVSF